MISNQEGKAMRPLWFLIAELTTIAVVIYALGWHDAAAVVAVIILFDMYNPVVVKLDLRNARLDQLIDQKRLQVVSSYNGTPYFLRFLTRYSITCLRRFWV